MSILGLESISLWALVTCSVLGRPVEDVVEDEDGLLPVQLIHHEHCGHALGAVGGEPGV